MDSRPLKVFLCHAHADRDSVRDLHARLTKDGVDAWLDKANLLPGQDWELEIRKAVRAADVVIVCLSKQFNQAGFRQKEVRLALDTAMEKPEGEIFIIPARLEECDNLESLRKWHWVDLFEDDGYEMLMKALRARANKIGIEGNKVIEDVMKSLDSSVPATQSDLNFSDQNKLFETPSEIYRRLPVYFLVPQGKSLAGQSIETIQRGIEFMLDELRNQPYVAGRIWLSFITYADQAHKIVPLTQLPKFTVPPLGARGANNLGAGFFELGRAILEDRITDAPSQKGDQKALVFVLIHQDPTDDWKKALSDLRHNVGAFINKIVVLTIGDTVRSSLARGVSEFVISISDIDPTILGFWFQWLTLSVNQNFHDYQSNRVEGMFVRLSTGQKILIEEKPFSSGAEGELFFSKDKTSIVKIFYSFFTENFRSTRYIVDQNSVVKEYPNLNSYLAWPEAVVTLPRLGVLIPRVENARPLDNYIRVAFWRSLNAEDKGSWDKRVTAVINIAKSVQWLHSKGFVHPDLSPKNILVNIHSGQTTLIDLDALVISGVNKPTVLGTPQCMAPEIVSGKSMPTTESSKHTLAVLIYWTLLLRHPLQGPKIYDKDPERDEMLAYGEKALYIEHPWDKSNRPEKLPFTTDMFPDYVQKLFYKTFVDGLHNSVLRPEPIDWVRALIKMADITLVCSNPNCVMKAYPMLHFDLDNAFISSPQCPWCGAYYEGTKTTTMRFMRILENEKEHIKHDDWLVAITPNRSIYSHHVSALENYELGRVAHFEKKDSYLQFVNDNLQDLYVIKNEKSIRLLIGEKIDIDSSMKIIFGHAEHYRQGVIDYSPATVL